MEWEDVPQVVDDWVNASAAPAWDMKSAAARTFTDTDVGYYYQPTTGKIALFAPEASKRDLALCKAAAVRAVGSDHVADLFLSYQDLTRPTCDLVKVAYSPTLRRIGELLNFFPGQYFGVIPNAPSPLAAMLTSGLVGAGLGYGAGRLAGAVLPGRWGKRLGRTGAILGGLAGATPGALWGLSSPYGWTDPRPLDPPAGSLDQSDPEMFKLSGDLGAALDAIPLGAMYKEAVNALTYDIPDRSGPFDPITVNINALGQTLWDHEAPPGMAAATMGALYAAQQLPDPRSRPGLVTGHQLGQLAANAAGDYTKGLLVGAALNAVVGTPYSANSYGMGNVALGIIGAVVPKLFGD